MAIAQTVISIVGKFNDQATPGINQLAGKLNAFGGVTGRVALGVGTLGAAVAALGVNIAVFQATTAVKALDALARSAGVTTNSIQELQAIASAAGVDASDLARGISALSTELGAGANISKATTDALDRLNLPIKELINLSPEQRFERVRAALSTIPSPAERAAVGTELLGRSYKELVPLIEKSSEELNTARVRLDTIGGPVSEAAAEKVRGISTVMGEVASAASKAGIEIGALFAPVVITGLEALAKTLGVVRIGLLGAGDEAVKTGQEIAKLEGRLVLFKNSQSDTGRQIARDLERQIKELRDKEAKLLGLARPGGEVSGARVTPAAPSPINLEGLAPTAKVSELERAAAAERSRQAALALEEVRITRARRATTPELSPTATQAERAAEKVAELRGRLEFEYDKGVIDAELFNKRIAEILDRVGGLEEVVPTARRVIAEVQKPLDGLTAAQERAAQSIQDAFVSAFSAIDQGIGGMVKGFLRAFAQILAQAAALDLANALGIGKIFSGGGGGGGGKSVTATVVSSIFRAFTGRAGGGLVTGPAVVGEDGPELLIPGATSMVMNRRQLAFAGASAGSVAYSPTTNIVVQGDMNKQSEARLLAYVEATRQKDQREMVRLLERNGMRNIR